MTNLWKDSEGKAVRLRPDFLHLACAHAGLLGHAPGRSSCGAAGRQYKRCNVQRSPLPDDPGTVLALAVVESTSPDLLSCDYLSNPAPNNFECKAYKIN
eukprot:scaffold143570_cov41-Prasinocladus_malaysianus.AAC.1